MNFTEYMENPARVAELWRQSPEYLERKAKRFDRLAEEGGCEGFSASQCRAIAREARAFARRDRK